MVSWLPGKPGPQQLFYTNTFPNTVLLLCWLFGRYRNIWYLPGICLLSHHPLLFLLPLCVLLCVPTFSTKRSSIVKTLSDVVKNTVRHPEKTSTWKHWNCAETATITWFQPSISKGFISMVPIYHRLREKEDKQWLSRRFIAAWVTCSTRVGLMGAGCCISEPSSLQTALKDTFSMYNFDIWFFFSK